MAFNNRTNHFQMHSTLPSLGAGEAGYTQGSYVPVMNGVARKYSRLLHIRDSRVTMHSWFRSWT